MDIEYQKKTVLNASFQDFLCTKLNNHMICFEKKSDVRIYVHLMSKTHIYTRKQIVFITYFK